MLFMFNRSSAPGSFSLDMVDGGDKYTEKDEQRNDKLD